jgi:HPt (histidine-containing phosphotransfer) domain-containing protein
MDGYVSKPVDPEQVEKAITEVMQTAATKPQPKPMRQETSAGGELALDRDGVRMRLRNKKVLQQVVALFQEGRPRQVAALREALSSQDAEAVARAAHTLKGTLANLGSTGARQAALALEEAGRCIPSPKENRLNTWDDA